MPDSLLAECKRLLEPYGFQVVEHEGFLFFHDPKGGVERFDVGEALELLAGLINDQGHFDEAKYQADRPRVRVV